MINKFSIYSFILFVFLSANYSKSIELNSNAIEQNRILIWRIKFKELSFEELLDAFIILNKVHTDKDTSIRLQNICNDLAYSILLANKCNFANSIKVIHDFICEIAKYNIKSDEFELLKVKLINSLTDQFNKVKYIYVGN